MTSRKTSIWMSDPLLKLKDNLPENRKFSGRISDIVERYSAIIANTEMPELAEAEIYTLSEVFSGGYITATKLKYLHEEIMETSSGSEEEKKALSDKVKGWTATEKVLFLEKYGI